MSRFVSLLLLSVCFYSCSKVDVVTTYYIRAKLNGQITQFAKQISAEKGVDNGKMVHLVLNGSSTDQSSYPLLKLEVWSFIDGIKIGTYTETDDITCMYNIDGNSEYTTVNANNDFTINITTLSSSELRGTFSGSVSDKNGVDIQITDGEFFVKFDY